MLNTGLILKHHIFSGYLHGFHSYGSLISHNDVIKWKHFPRYWPFVRGIHRSPVNSPLKGQWRGALIFSLVCAWINGWVNNGEAGDLRRYRVHCDVIVMIIFHSHNMVPVHSCMWCGEMLRSTNHQGLPIYRNPWWITCLASYVEIYSTRRPFVYMYNDVCIFLSLQRRHNDHDGVSNHQSQDCLLNHLFRRRSKKTSKHRVIGLCSGNSPVTCAQRASDAENGSIDDVIMCRLTLIPVTCFYNLLYVVGQQLIFS